MSLKARVKKLEEASQPPDKKLHVVMMHYDGVILDGQRLSLEEYAEQYPDGPGGDVYIIKVGGNLSVDDL